MTCLPMVTTKARVWPGLNGKRWIDLWNRTYTTEYHDKEKKMRKTIVILIAVVIVTLTVSLVAQASDPVTVPEPGATGVSVGTNVTASGQIPMRVGNCITLEGPGGQVDGTRTGCDGSSTTATFDPTNDLAPNTTYTACIWYEPAGRSLDNDEPDYCWTFTTASPVGGLTYPNDTVHLLTPWVALGCLALAGGAVTLRKRMD